ncbi:hypothetical protein VE26_05735 [Devosia chinhatensis]|uniref:Uncharacterized protein n=1 Tax=Devosia chinhatensis TaxID=429727 RepID=A0A0F5FMI6_9HYPH|nr:hypothetical protein VE26_05735 [Devosia chinhatensis]
MNTRIIQWFPNFIEIKFTLLLHYIACKQNVILQFWEPPGFSRVLHERRIHMIALIVLAAAAPICLLAGIFLSLGTDNPLSASEETPC